MRISQSVLDRMNVCNGQTQLASVSVTVYVVQPNVHCL